jgi:ABC-type nickel/cobalt efflux system permease component RcnA
MEPTLQILAATAFVLALTHTVIGVDHYLPFVVLGRANRWSYGKLALVTTVCGIGHVLSSVALGMVGIFAGVAVAKLEGIEAWRGDLASYLIIAFGLIYMLWGLREVHRGKAHSHAHTHADGSHHDHGHDHSGGHNHPHLDKPSRVFWVLFLVFVFGPCEPLIPLLMYPAAKLSMAGVVLVAGIFAVVTIATMLGMTLLLYGGLKRIRFALLERYMHPLAGLMIMAAGLLVVFAGI